MVAVQRAGGRMDIPRAELVRMPEHRHLIVDPLPQSFRLTLYTPTLVRPGEEGGRA
jgi:hypothetical protein